MTEKTFTVKVHVLKNEHQNPPFPLHHTKKKEKKERKKVTPKLAPPTTKTDKISAINWTLAITPKPTTLENRQVLIRLVQSICAWLHVQQVDMCTHTRTHTHSLTQSSSQKAFLVTTLKQSSTKMEHLQFHLDYLQHKLKPRSEVQSLYKFNSLKKLLKLYQSKFIGPRGTKRG